MEQENDDFERQFRQAASALESFERTVDERLEENAMLQQDLDHQNTINQQLREEIKGVLVSQ